ncbi:MAG: ABC transporter permease [Flavobacteriales bacterium]
MFKNYFITALRNFRRNKLSSLLNIIGLSAGIASCLFIYIYVSDELSYDADFSKSDRIYRLQSFYKFDDVDDKFGITPFPAIPAIVKDNPEVESGTRITEIGPLEVKRNNQTFKADRVFFADTNFFSVFDFPFLAGNPKNALAEPMSVVLTATEAERLFGQEDPIGKTIDFRKTYKVTGVIEDKKFKTHLPIGYLISMSSADTSFINSLQDNWGNNNSLSYIILPQSGMEKKFQPKLDQIVNNYQLPQWQSSGFNGTIEMHIEPLKEVHFNDYLIYDVEEKGNKTYVLIFSIVAILTLIIACINFVNLATATASRRAKEVAMRKVAGATRKQLITQFIGEAFLTTLFSALIAFALLELLIPYFNYITGKEMKSSDLLNGEFLLAVGGLIIFIGLVAGSYPAFFISKLPVTAIFRDARSSLGKSGTLRKILVTTQFTISIALIVATLSVLSQLRFMRNKDLGFQTGNMLCVNLPAGDTSQYAPLQAFKNDMRGLAFVKSVSHTANVPGNATGRYVLNVNTPSGKQDKPFPFMVTDSDYLKASRMTLSEGRLFTEADAANPFGYAIVNEATVRACGWTNPLNEIISIPGDGVNPPQEIRIIGVIKDFHYASLHHPIEPLVIAQQNQRGAGGYVVAELEPGELQNNLSTIESLWKKSFPESEFEYTFMDENFAKLYVAEEKMLSITTYFAGLAILLCCLGLYGLSAFTTQQRTKEIGIRKVMGASVSNILVLINKDFILLVGISIVLSLPLAWFGVTSWYENFAYHENVQYLFFALAALFAVLLSITTVSLHAMGTALRDPIKALRYE